MKLPHVDLKSEQLM